MLPNILMVNCEDTLLRNFSNQIYVLLEKAGLFRRYLEHKFLERKVPDTSNLKVLQIFFEEIDRICLFQNISYGVYVLDMPGKYSGETLELLIDYMESNFDSKKFILHCTEQSVEKLLLDRLPLLLVRSRRNPDDYVRQKLKKSRLDVSETVICEMAEILLAESEDKWNILWKNMMFTLYCYNCDEERMSSLKTFSCRGSKGRIGFGV